MSEIRECLAVKNTIPNVSAVLFRRQALLDAIHRDLDTMCSFRIAGDWATYLAVLEQGDIAFVPESLNLHRRHASSVTIGSDQHPHMREVLRMQREVARRYHPDPDVVERATSYAARLRRYFGLDESEAARRRPGHALPATDGPA